MVKKITLLEMLIDFLLNKIMKEYLCHDSCG